MTATQRISRHRRGDYSCGLAELHGAFADQIDATLVFKPHLSGSEWAERHGWIPKGTGAESGPVTLYGYQRGLLDAMCDPHVPLVTVLKAARVGYTRCATLATAYHLHQDPTLCCLAQPTIPDAEDFGGSEIAPMLRETPVLAGLLRPVRKGEKQDKATFYQLANGASARIVGAASDDAFRRYSARFLFADEIDGDGWTPGAKTQGDKLKLFWTRGETFWNRKQVRGSTPLLQETSRIWKLWLQSDQRRYFVPCPQCSEAAGQHDGWQYLDWGGKDASHGLKWDLDDDGRLLKVWYVGTCGCIINESHKAWMDARGEWRATATARTSGHVGFHLWTGMSLNPNAAWPIIVQEWLEAQDDPASLVQPFANLRLGRPYKARYGQEVKASKFLARSEIYGAEVPAWAEFLTVGVDVQSGAKARLEAGVWAWGRGLECALIGHFVLPGDPAQPEVWHALDRLLLRGFARTDGKTLAVQATCIDSGGHHTAETYAFANERRGRRIWAIKGRSETMGRRSKVWPREPTNKLGNVFYLIGGNAARDFVYGSLAIEKVGVRYVHFPQDGAAGSRKIDEDFFEQMTGERLVVRRQGFTEWEKPKDKAREAGVCFVYAYAAVCGLQAKNALFVATGSMPAASDPTPPPAAPTPVPPPATSWLQPDPERQHSNFRPGAPGGGWMQRGRS